MIRFLSACVAACVTASATANPREADVFVYGATPSGIAATLAAAKDGHSVILADSYARIGGMVTHGLSHTDFRTFEGLTGSYLDFTNQIQEYYRREYGPDSPQANGTFRGTHAEPKVNLAVFEAMLAAYPKVTILRTHRLTDVRLDDNQIKTATLTHDGNTIEVTANLFIDGTYEGDLMAAAKVPYRVGREGRDEYNESLAPPTGDDQLQGYNFRLMMTQKESNRVEIEVPSGYNREDYLGILPLYEDGKLTRVFGKLGDPPNHVYKVQYPLLPNGKTDINDVSRGRVRLSMPGENQGWPDGDAEERQEIFDKHLRWNVGMLYFLQNDDAVPAKIREDARQWGWCKDEFPETGHIPPMVYVREARRMVGQYIFTQADTRYAPEDARAVLRKDSIAIGDYGHNCHGTAHEGPRFGGTHTGEFYQSVPPYQIPYGVLVPKEVANLLVPCAMSSSHVGFCALRLEPIWTNLGQAAGHAAHVALKDGVPVQKVSVTAVQKRLRDEGAATIYVSDVPPGDEDFAVVQWWSTLGGLHGLEPAPARSGQRGKNITGQYFEAYPGHEAKLDEVLTAEVATRWRKLAEEVELPGEKLPKADGKITRGDWLRKVYSLAKGS